MHAFNTAIGRQAQVDLHEFETSLVYKEELQATQGWIVRPAPLPHKHILKVVDKLFV